MKILFAENCDIRPALQQQLGDNGRHPGEKVRTELVFKTGQRRLHAVAHAPSRQVDRRAVMQPGDQRGLVGIRLVALGDIRLVQPADDLDLLSSPSLRC